MTPSYIDGKESCKGTTCSKCGRPLAMEAGLALQPRIEGECICDDCYHDMLVPGPGDAYGNMS